MNQETLCNKLIEYRKADYIQLREIHLKQQGRLIENLQDKFEQYNRRYDGNAYNNFINFLRFQQVEVENVLTITPMNKFVLRSIHKKNKRFVELAKDLHYPYILEYESAILDQNIISLRNNSLQNIEPNYFRDYLFEIIRLNDLEKIWVKEHG